MHKLLAMREAQSIAFREFQLFAHRYPIEPMKTIGEIRLDNLLLLIERHGSLAKLNQEIGLARTDATLSQIKNRSPDSKTGTPKAMGTPVARRIELKLKLEVGWMDNPHAPMSYRQELINNVVTAMEKMPDHQILQTQRIVDAIPQPMPSTNEVQEREGIQEKTRKSG
jgi:hypothetical protein